MPMLWLRASTVDGLLAKAAAMKFVFPDDDAIRKRIEGRLKEALARDPLALASAAATTA